MKKLAIILMMIFLLVGCSSHSDKQSEKEKIKIGISQIVEYVALDDARLGFLEALNEGGYKDGENIEVDYQNAQGDIATAQTIANNFVSQNKDLIFAIATPSAQGAYNATKDIPIMISAVTDPLAAGIVKSLEEPQTNVSGTCDYIPVQKQLELVKSLLPDAKNIGVLYNTSEVNSEVQVKELQKASKDLGYKIIPVGISSTNEVNEAISSLVEKIDVLYAPTDQLVVSSMPIIVQKTMEKKIPIIAAEKGAVELGALATQGIDYHALGKKTGQMAIKVLKGEDISKMSIQMPTQTQVIINEDTLKTLGVKKPTSENIEYIHNK